EQRIEHVLGRSTASQRVEPRACDTKLLGDQQQITLPLNPPDRGEYVTDQHPVPCVESRLAGPGQRLPGMLDQIRTQSVQPLAGHPRNSVPRMHFVNMPALVAATVDLP